MSQELCYRPTGFDFKFAFGPEKFPGLLRNGTLQLPVDLLAALVNEEVIIRVRKPVGLNFSRFLFATA